MSMADSAKLSAASLNPLQSEPTPPAVLLRQLTKRFGERLILDAVDLQVTPGERVALLGDSGCGKSTLLNLIAGLEPADSGAILIAGHPMNAGDEESAASVRRSSIGFAFQAFHLLAHLDAQRNVAVPLLLAGVSADEALSRAADMLARLGLGARLRAPVRELSGGEPQRIALARALISRPALILADEPTGNLDPANARAALDLIADEAAQCGSALLLVTHSQDAADIAERRFGLAAGRLHPV